jgi:serine protease Do
VRAVRVAGAALALLLAASCTTTVPRSPAPPLGKASLDRVQGLLDAGSVLQAFPQIELLRAAASGQPNSPAGGAAGGGSAGIDPAAVAALEVRAREELAKAFARAVTDKSWEDAIRLLRSAAVLGQGDLPGEWTEKALREAQAATLESAGEALPALFARLRALSAGEPSREDLTSALEKARGLGSRGIARSLAARLAELGAGPPEDPAGPPSFTDMLKGTVTIWVNKGIRIEKGVGYPDRIIGSAFFIDPRGYLLTNYHVVKSEVDPTYEGYSRLFVRFDENTGEKIPARVVGWDPVFDLALLKAETGAGYVFSGDGAVRVSPGDRVFAIGSPAGLEKTVTSGIVSATGRRFLQMGDTIQVDVPLNPGNSGGPLLSEAGGLIGIVFAGLEQFEGINFAVPYLWIEQSLPLLFAGGQAVYPWLGAALAETEKGLEVLYTLPGGPAAESGLAAGDIITHVGGRPVKSLRDAQEIVLKERPPALLRLASVREGKPSEVLVCLSPRPQNPITTALEKDRRETVLYPLFGMRLERTGGSLRGGKFVVKRVTRGSTADEAGISENDPLTIQDWKVDQEKGYAVLQVYVKKRRAGFIESVVQIAAWLETSNFL